MLAGRTMGRLARGNSNTVNGLKPPQFVDLGRCVGDVTHDVEWYALADDPKVDFAKYGNVVVAYLVTHINIYKNGEQLVLPQDLMTKTVASPWRTSNP